MMEQCSYCAAALLRVDQALTVIQGNERFYELIQQTRKDFLQQHQNQLCKILNAEEGTFLYAECRLQLEKKADIEYSFVLRDKPVVLCGHFCAGEQDSLLWCVLLEHPTAVRSDAQKDAALLDSIDGGIAQLALEEKKLTVLEASDGFYRLHGRSKEEYDHELAHSPDTMIPPQSHQKFVEVLSQASAEKAVGIEYPIIQKDGSVIWNYCKAKVMRRRKGQTLFQCVFMDITPTKVMQQKLELLQQRYRIASGISDDIIYEYDIDKDQLSLNCYSCCRDSQTVPEKHSKIRALSQVLAQNEQIFPEDRFRLQQMIKTLHEGGTPPELLEIRLLQQGEYQWNQLYSSPVYGADGAVERVIGKLTNIHRQKQKEDHLREQSQKDPLTELYNRNGVDLQMQAVFHQKVPTYGAFLILDVDNFKEANDILGHLYGDRVLKQVACALRHTFRGTDIMGRIGGDEFVAFLFGVQTKERLREKARVLQEFLFASNSEKSKYRLSLSIGASIYPQDGNCYEELFQKADEALYMAKRKGKNRLEVYHPD